MMRQLGRPRAGQRSGMGAAAVCLVIACADPTPEADPPAFTPDDARAAEVAVDAAVNSFKAAEIDRDAALVIAHLWPEFHMYQDGTRADYDEVVGQIRSTFPTLRSFASDWTDVRVQALASDLVLSSLHFRDSIVTVEGDVIQSQGPTTLIWERRNGEWRILYGDADHYPVGPG